MWLQRIRSQCRQNHKEASRILYPSTLYDDEMWSRSDDEQSHYVFARTAKTVMIVAICTYEWNNTKVHILVLGKMPKES